MKDSAVIMWQNQIKLKKIKEIFLKHHMLSETLTTLVQIKI